MANYFDYYRIFYSVAKHKNITVAANELYISQSTVSRSIQKLEYELGCTLFVRTRQGVELTEEGRLLYHHVAAACEHFEVAEEKIKQIKDLKKGKIRIGATEMTMQFFLLPFLEHFRDEFPQIHISLSFGYPESLLPRLNSGIIDLAILTTPLCVDETVTITPLMKFQDILIAGEKFSHLTKKKTHICELEKEPFILMEPGTSARNYIETFFEKNQVHIQSECDVSSMPMIAPMVQLNMGIGFVPTLYVHRELAMGTIRKINLIEKLPERQICLCTSNVYPMHAACREFVNHLKE